MSISVPRTFFEVLVRACTDGTSVSELCDVSEETSPATDVLYHLRGLDQSAYDEVIQDVPATDTQFAER